MNLDYFGWNFHIPWIAEGMVIPNGKIFHTFFFLIWYFTFKEALLEIRLTKKDSDIILICPKPNCHFYGLCNTKLE